MVAAHFAVLLVACVVCVVLVLLVVVGIVDLWLCCWARQFPAAPRSPPAAVFFQDMHALEWANVGQIKASPAPLTNNSHPQDSECKPYNPTILNPKLYSRNPIAPDSSLYSEPPNCASHFLELPNPTLTDVGRS